MIIEKGITHGKEQLKIFGGKHAEFIKMAIHALEMQKKLAKYTWTSWNDNNCHLIDGAIVFKHLFPYVTWEDEEPTRINSLLDKKEKYFIKHYILNNPCFRKMKVNFIRKCLYDAHNGGMYLEVEFDNHDFSYTNIPIPDGMFENLRLEIMYRVDEILI